MHRDAGGNAGFFLGNSKQSVVCIDIFVIKTLCLVIGQLHHDTRAFGKTFLYKQPLRFGSGSLNLVECVLTRHLGGASTQGAVLDR